MKYLLIFLFMISAVFGDNLSERLDRLIQSKQVKTVINLKYDPFFTKKEEKKLKKKETKANKNITKQKLKLITIFNGKAFIDGKWLSKNDKIYGYIVKKISNNDVILEGKNRNLTLRFEKTKEILKVRRQ